MKPESTVNNKKLKTAAGSLPASGAGLTKEDFCRLYGEYKDKLYRYALYRLGDPGEAEDAVSDCIMAAWQSIGKLRSTEAFGAWIFSILRNCCAAHIREAIRKRRADEVLAEAASSDNAVTLSGTYSGVSGGIAASHPDSLGIELAEALRLLTDDEREIVLLSVIGGLSSKEISAETGLTSGSVRSKLSRSLTKMRKFLS